MRTYCTLFDAGYLARGLALYHSLVRNDRPFELYALCLDEQARAAIEKEALDHVRVVTLAELEEGDTALLDIKGSRTPTEYCYTLTPTWTRYVLDHLEPNAWVTYLDADILFYSSPEPIFAELTGASVGIVPQRFAEDEHVLERFGRYNASLVAVRNDDVGSAVLKDWRERCLDWCYDRVDEPGGRFADQKYLDAWPATFERVHEIQHPGAGIAPWNWKAADIDAEHEPPQVQGGPLIYYHFHDFRFVGASGFASGLAPNARMPARVFDRLYREYAQELVARSREGGVHVEREPVWAGPVSVASVRRSARLIWGMLAGNIASERTPER